MKHERLGAQTGEVANAWVPNPLSSKLVEMRRRDIGLTIATKIIREIFTDDPENVGAFFR